MFLNLSCLNNCSFEGMKSSLFLSFDFQAELLLTPRPLTLWSFAGIRSKGRNLLKGA